MKRLIIHKILIYLFKNKLSDNVYEINLFSYLYKQVQNKLKRYDVNDKDIVYIINLFKSIYNIKESIHCNLTEQERYIMLVEYHKKENLIRELLKENMKLHNEKDE